MIAMHRLRPPRKGAVQGQWEFQQMGHMSARIISWGLTPFKSIADAQAMDRQYDGSWGIDLVGYGRLAAVAKDGQW